ncbi:MAG: hypothetical protein KGQ88_11310 [Chloroflexi bacterium]|nr:hypothetical protein [Chloroflexota bacterium]
MLAFVAGGLGGYELATNGPPIAIPLLGGTEDRVAVHGTEQPPAWISDFAAAFCRGDAQSVTSWLGAPYEGRLDEVTQALSERAWECSEMRFIGGGSDSSGTFYVYVMTDTQNANEEWWVFTTAEDKVIGID